MSSPYLPFVYVIDLIVQRLVMQCGTFELWSPHHTGLPVSLSTNGARVDTQHSETLRAERDGGRFFFKRAKLSKERQSGKSDIQMEWRICKYFPEALLVRWSSFFFVCFFMYFWVRFDKSWEFLWTEKSFVFLFLFKQPYVLTPLSLVDLH